MSTFGAEKSRLYLNGKDLGLPPPMSDIPRIDKYVSGKSALVCVGNSFTRGMIDTVTTEAGGLRISLCPVTAHYEKSDGGQLVQSLNFPFETSYVLHPTTEEKITIHMGAAEIRNALKQLQWRGKPPLTPK
jgi:hypothetical protein